MSAQRYSWRFSQVALYVAQFSTFASAETCRNMGVSDMPLWHSCENKSPRSAIQYSQNVPAAYRFVNVLPSCKTPDPQAGRSTTCQSRGLSMPYLQVWPSRATYASTDRVPLVQLLPLLLGQQVWDLLSQPAAWHSSAALPAAQHLAAASTPRVG